MPRLKSDIQERFCQNIVLESRDQIEAYKQAGYKPSNNNSAGAAACLLMKQSHIQKRLNELRTKQMAISTRTAGDVILELEKLAFINSQDLYDKNGVLIPIKDLPRHIAAAIIGIDQTVIKTKGGKILKVTTKYKLANKLSANNLLAKHHQIYNPLNTGNKNLDEQKRLLVSPRAMKRLLERKAVLDLVKDKSVDEIKSMMLKNEAQEAEVL